MTLRKIAEPPDGYWSASKKPEPCRHPDHDFPSHIVLEPGTWEHTCPGCGETQQVTVGITTWTERG